MKRLDIHLTEIFKGEYTRSQITNAIKDGYVTINGKIVTKAGTEICRFDHINMLVMPQSVNAEPEDIEIDIVFEDEHLMIINKPRGMVVHPGAGNKNGTLLNALLNYYKTDGVNQKDSDSEMHISTLTRAGIVHRIDKNTAGLMVVAKTANVQAKLAALLEKHEVRRIYHGIVEGIWEGEGTIDRNIIRDQNHRTLFTVTEKGGRRAITHYKVLKTFEAPNVKSKTSKKGFSLVEFRLETGRTHQIRVHCKSVGHPLVGDPEYNPHGTLKTSGQMLESIKIEFIHPITNEKISKFADTTPEFKGVLSKIV